jgi:hypothetical protein
VSDRHLHRRAYPIARVVAVLLVSACAAEDTAWQGTLPSPDGKQFTEDVYPLLLRDCAFSTCHGAPERFLQVYGPGRTRLDPIANKADDPMTLAEVLHSYERARSMLTSVAALDQSPLLRKPLELQAGGESHKGVDDFGRNVYPSQADVRYVTLLRWAGSRGLQPIAADVAAASATATP